MHAVRRALPLLLAILTPAVVRGSEFIGTSGPFCKAKSFSIREGETRQGDLYVLASTLTVVGTQQGDLFGMGDSMTITGEVTGDVVMFGRSLDIDGTVRDTVRSWSQMLTISGTVEGDVLAFAGNVHIKHGAHVLGNVIVGSGGFILDGTVDGDLRVVAGEIGLNGEVGRTARLKADAIQLDAHARIGGDLIYTSRKEIDPAALSIVEGEVQFHDKEKEEAEQKAESREKSGPSLWSIGWWMWWTVGTMLVGFVVLAVGGGRFLEPALEPLGRETLQSSLVGLGVSFVGLAASGLAILLILSLPLGVLGLLLFLVAIYLAKLPVALWVGRRLLRLFGMGHPSAYLALAVGLALLYLLFEIPWFIGTLLWFETIWLGLGSTILGARGSLQRPAAS